MEASGAVECVRCLTPHHRDCFAYSGVCSVYACGSTRSRAWSPSAAAAMVFTAGLAAEAAPRNQTAASPPGAPTVPQAVAIAADPSGDAWFFEGLAWLGGLAAFWALFSGSEPAGLGPIGWLAISVSVQMAVRIWIALRKTSLVFRPGTRTIDRETRFFGSTGFETLYEFGDFDAAGTGLQDVWELTSQGESPSHRRACPVLRRTDGRLLPVGLFLGGPGASASQEVRRTVGRICKTMGVRNLGDCPLPRRWSWERFQRLPGNLDTWFVGLLALAWVVEVMAEMLGEPGLSLMRLGEFAMGCWMAGELVARASGGDLLPPPSAPPETDRYQSSALLHILGAIAVAATVLISASAHLAGGASLTHGTLRQTEAEVLKISEAWARPGDRPSPDKVDALMSYKTGRADYLAWARRVKSDRFTPGVKVSCWYPADNPSSAVFDVQPVPAAVPQFAAFLFLGLYLWGLVVDLLRRSGPRTRGRSGRKR
jgi:hypothetical protein